MGSLRQILKLDRVCQALIILSLFLSSCTTDTAFGRALSWGLSDTGDIDKFPSAPIKGGTGASPFEIAIDSGSKARVQAAFEKVNTRFSGRAPNQDFENYLATSSTSGFLVLSRGKIIFEWYKKGSNPQTFFTSFSVSKSIVSILVGRAVDEGLIRLDDPITRFIPELSQRDTRFSKITITNLLQMNSGIAYHEGLFAFDDIRTYYEPQLFDSCIATISIESEPGQKFVYNNFNPILLGIILERSSGLSLTDFASRYYWAHLGAQDDASWSLSTAAGNPKMESGFNARLRDFGLIGYRFMHDESSYSQTAKSPTKAPDPSYYRGAWFEGNLLYGYFWYAYPKPDSEQYLAAGHLGQYIYLNLQKDLVIVRLGDDDGPPGRNWMHWFEEFSEHFM